MSPLTSEERDDRSPEGRLLRVELGLDGMKTQIGGLADLLSRLDAKIDTMQHHKPVNWPALASMVCAVGGVGWALISLNVQSSTAKLEVVIEAQQEIANLRGAFDEQKFALLWQKAYGERYPEIATDPRIGPGALGAPPLGEK